MKLLLISVALVAVAVVLLGIKVFFVKGGEFPSGHAHDLKKINRRNK